MRFPPLPTRSVLVLLLIFGLILLSPGASQFAIAQAAGNPQGSAPVDFDTAMTRIRAVRDAVDRRQFDVDLLSSDFAFSGPDEIVNWVRSNIAYEEYSGALRGAAGTLRSRAGNSLDQSLLLAHLLRDAGLDVVIARGNLGPDDAVRLVNAMWRKVEPRPDSVDSSKLDAIAGTSNGSDETAVDRVVDLSGAWGPVSPDAVDTYVADITARITDGLSTAGVQLGRSQSTDELVAEARDYCWVRYRLAPTAPWTDVHLGFPAGEPPQVGPDETFTDTIPQGLLFRLRVEAFVDVTSGDKTESHALIAPWERPVANLNGSTVSVTLVPDSILGRDPQAGPGTPNMFFPLVSGAIPAGAQAFDLDGNVAPLEAAASPFAGVFQAEAKATNRAAGALGGIGGGNVADQDARARRVTSVWLKVSVVGPDGEATSHRHDIASRGLNEPDDGFGDRLWTRVAIAADGARFPDAYVLDHLLSDLVDAEPLLKRIMVEGNGAPTIGPIPQGYVRGELGRINARTAQLSYLMASFDRGPIDDGVVRFRNAPAVVLFQQGMAGPATNRSIDLAQSPWRVLDASGSVVEARPDLALRAGVREGLQEGVYLSALSGSPAVTAASLFVESPNGLPVVLRPDVVDSSAVSQLPSHVQELIEHELAAGYVIVLPPVSRPATPAWWRIDPQTGETVGMLWNGMGGAVQQRSVLSEPRVPPRPLLAQDDSEELELQTIPEGDLIKVEEAFGVRLLCAGVLVVLVLFEIAVYLGLAALIATVPGVGVKFGLGIVIAALKKLRNLPALSGETYDAYMDACIAAVVGG